MEKKKSIAPKLMFVFISIIFVSSILAMWQPNKNEQDVDGTPFDYKGHTFFELATGQVATIIHFKDSNQTIFVQDPRELEDIIIKEDAVNALAASDKVYVTFDPTQKNISFVSESAKSIASAVFNFYTEDVVFAYSKDAVPVDPNVPLRSCEQASLKEPVVFLSIGSVNRVNLEKNCVMVSGKTYSDLQRTAGKLVMWLIGMKV